MINAGFSIAILKYTSIRVYQLSPSLTSNPVFEATLTFRHGEALREEVPWNGNFQKRLKSWIRSKHILTGKCDLVFFWEAYYTVASVSKFRYDLISLDGWLKILLPMLFLLDSFTKRWTCHQHCGVFKHIYDIYKLSRYSRSWCNTAFQLKPKLRDVLCSGFHGVWFLRAGIERQERYHICLRKRVNWKNHENYRVLFWFGILWLCLICVILKLKLGLPMPDGFFGHANLWRSEAWNAGRWMLTSVCSLPGVGLYHSVSYCVTVDNIRCLIFLQDFTRCHMFCNACLAYSWYSVHL